MSIALIGGLLLACVYLYKRTFDIRAENATLRDEVVKLKRRLAKQRS